MSSLLSNTAATLSLLVLGVLEVPLRSQALPATPHTPDLLGVYPGMTDRAARVQLQKHSSTVSVQSSGTDSNLSLRTTDGTTPDLIDVYMTQEPNDPPTVWRIQRSQNGNGTTLALTGVITALREKYGKETLTWDRGPGGLLLYWIFDPNGKLLVSADPVLQGCDGVDFIRYMSIGLPQQLNDMEKACYGAFFAVRASFNRRDSQLLNAYTVELVNLPYAYKAAMSTTAAKSGAAEKARQEEINRANKNKPAF